MRILVVGATGTIGTAVADTLAARGHEVLRASRSSRLAVDTLDPMSIQALLDAVGPLDAVISAVGSVAFKPLLELRREDFEAGFRSKVLGQVELAQRAVPLLADGGSITLTTGILSREPVRAGSAASLVNGAVESFVLAAATELPRGIRINAVSPSVLVEATGYHDAFPGFEQVTAASVAQSFLHSVEGVQTGQVLVPR